MIIDKPPWVRHSGTPIFSVDISCDGRRFATAGQDHKVKVWNLAPLLDVNLEIEKDLPKLLATLGDHFGPVNVVRFSHSGKYLASGADDKLVCIYEIKTGPGKSTFGNSEINYENWKHTFPLRGHQNNVTDLAWSPDDKLIATCSLDNLVIIWDSQTGQRLKTLEGHTSYVKGVSWDPIGKYLASQSDDQSVLVWKTDDWTLVQRITDPFKVHVSSTFSLRLDWSTDGTYLLAVNSCIHPQHTAVALKRAGWESEYRLVGHAGPVVVARHSNRLFYVKGPDGQPTDSATTLVALGSTDKKVSVWLVNTTAAICAFKRGFDQSVYDLAWTPDGYSLLAASSDGTVAVLQFEAHEVGKHVPDMEKDQLLKDLYGNTKPTATVFAESAAQLQLEEASGNSPNTAAGPVSLSASEKLQSLDARLGGADGRPSTVASRLPSTTQTARKLSEVRIPSGNLSNLAPVRPEQRQPDGGSRSDPKAPEVREKRRVEPNAVAPVTEKRRLEPVAVNADEVATKRKQDSKPAEVREKRRVEPLAVPNDEGPSNRALADRVSPKRSGVGEQPVPAAPSSAPPVAIKSAIKIPQPAFSKSVVVKLGVEPSLTDQEQPHMRMLEATNRTGTCLGRPTCDVVCTAAGKRVWSDRLVGTAAHVVGSLKFSAVTLDTGMLQVYTPAGRRMLPPLKLSAPPAFCCCDGGWQLLLVCCDATVRSWDVGKQTLVLEGSVAPLLTPNTHHAKPVSLSAVRFTSSGCALAVLSTRHAYVYHPHMNTWMAVADDTFPSSAFNTMLSFGSKGQGELSALQSSCHQSQSLLPSSSVRVSADVTYQQSRAHLETNMAAALAMNAAQDYRRWMITYVRQLADSGDEARLREVCTELLGPTWYRSEGVACTEAARQAQANGKPPPDGDDAWQATVLHLNKRTLLRDVLREVSRNRAHQRLVTEFTDTLDEIEGEVQDMEA